MAGDYKTSTYLELVLQESAMSKVASKVGEMFATQASRFSSGMKMPISQASGASQTAGAVAGGMKDIGGAFLKSSMGKIISALGPLAIVASILGDLMQFIEPFIKLFSYLVLMFLVPVFRILKESLGKLFGFLGIGSEDKKGVTTPMAIAQTAIAGILSPLGMLSPLISFFDLLLKPEKLKEIIDNIYSSIDGMVKKVSSILAPIFKPFIDSALEAWNSFNDNLVKPVLDSLSTIATNFLEFSTKALGYVNDNLVKPIVEKIVGLEKSFTDSFITPVISSLQSFITDIKNNIFKPIVEWMKTNILDPLSEGWTGLYNDVSGVWTDIKTKIEEVYNSVKPMIEFLKGITPSPGNFTTGIFSGISSMIGNLLNPFTSKDDFVWRPGEGAVSISPQDTLIGAKDMKGIMGGGQNITYSPTYNITAGIEGSYLTKILKEHDDNFRRNILGRTSYVTNLRP